jgi:hypothetical protein
MIDWLNKPFPFIESVKEQIIISFLSASFVYFFLLIFQPFGISEVEVYKPLYALGFFVITLLSLLVNFLLVTLAFKSIFKPENWTVSKNIYFMFWLLLVMTVFNWIYNSRFECEVVEQHGFLRFLFMTLSVGIFPVIFFTLYTEYILSNKHKLIAKELDAKIHEPVTQEDKQIEILAENGKDAIELGLDQFICIRSEGNYADVFFIENDELKKKLIRNSLVKIAQQLMNFETVKRCHRSYIVNLQNVNTVSGNARNYNFHVEKLNFAIPVSRNFPKSIIQNIK